MYFVRNLIFLFCIWFCTIHNSTEKAISWYKAPSPALCKAHLFNTVNIVCDFKLKSGAVHPSINTQLADTMQCCSEGCSFLKIKSTYCEDSKSNPGFAFDDDIDVWQMLWRASKMNKVFVTTITTTKAPEIIKTTTPWSIYESLGKGILPYWSFPI